MNARLRRLGRSRANPLTASRASWRRGRVRRGALTAALLVLGVLIADASPANAAVITVNTLEDELNADGDCSLREAIEAANTNTAVDACPAGDPAPILDTIVFGVTGTITLGSQLTISDDLTIDGPGAADLTVSGGGTTRVLEVAGGVTLILEGVTVANGSAPLEDAGGIRNSGTLTVSNSAFSGNSAHQNGGGINNLGTLTVTNSTFSGNSSTFNHGGAIYNNFTATLTITNSTFTGNSAGIHGGAIVNQDGTLNVSNSTFSSNSAGLDGGAIDCCFNGTMTVTSSTFSNNSAGGTGGGINNFFFSFVATMTVTNSTFSGNAAGSGGGIYTPQEGAMVVTNSTFSGNTAGSGGGIVGGALRNTIVANSPSGGNCSGTVTDGGGNLQHPGMDCGATITSADPMLDPAGLQDNGGPTQTIALQPGSPAIDAAVLANCPATDQRGVPRPQGAGCDIGSFELEMPEGADLSLTKTDSPDPAQVKKVLTYTLTVTNGGPDDATAVTVEDQLPAGVQFVSATASQGTCTQAGGVVTCSLGSVANGASATVTIKVRPTARGTLTNTAEVEAAEPDPNPGNNSDTETTEVTQSGGVKPPPTCTVKPCP